MRKKSSRQKYSNFLLTAFHDQSNFDAPIINTNLLETILFFKFGSFPKIDDKNFWITFGCKIINASFSFMNLAFDELVKYFNEEVFILKIGVFQNSSKCGEQNWVDRCEAFKRKRSKDRKTLYFFCLQQMKPQV